ncbi:phage major capsid protein [Antribacter gilvus]|uniref:phage major capsid protein n=1 Tax=Antribacter gilvus TaxID=2304675 RepID=UPI000F7B1339|nr:phage major capsid protein [Antribacter gilvus]
MTSIADTLMERRAALITKAQEIATKGVTEGRDLSVEEQTDFDQMIAEAETLAKRASAIAEGEQRGRELEESFRSVTGRDPQKASEGKSSEFETWARNARVGDGYDIAPVRGAEARAIRNRGAETRDMSATGGVGPNGVYGQLWEYAVSTTQLLQAGVDIINTADGNTLPMPRATAHAATDGAAVAAHGAIVESDSTIDTVNLSVAKYGFLTDVPTELVQDVTFDLEGYIARNAGRALGRRISQVAAAAAIAGFTTAGVTGPVGTSTTLGSQTTAGQGSDLLVDLFHSVLNDYRNGAAWVMGDPTAAMIRKLKTSTGELVWQPALTAGDPDLVLGKPVYIDSFFATPAANAKSIFFGDWSALKVRIAGGLRFERSAEYHFGNDQVTFRALVRTGAVAIDPNAVKFFAHSAT